MAHATQCPYCITGHTKAVRRAGATPEELMEAIWVAAEMRAGNAALAWAKQGKQARLLFGASGTERSNAGVPHKVAPLGPVRFLVQFHRTSGPAAGDAFASVRSTRAGRWRSRAAWPDHESGTYAYSHAQAGAV